MGRAWGGRGWIAGMVLAGMATLGAAEVAHAQSRGPYGPVLERRESRNPKFALDLHLMGADAVGEFEQLVGGAFGGQLGVRFGIDRRSILGLRVDGGFMIYGLERTALCFPVPIGCRIGADLTTTNTIGYGGVGPELAIPGDVSPYIFATYGFSWFSTQSSLSGANDWEEDLFNTRHYNDFVGAQRLGGGLRVRLNGTIALDLGAEYHRNGIAEYLREGDILDNPDGSITVFPNRTEANLTTFRLGIQIGLGGGGDDRWEEDRRRRSRR